MWLIASCFEKEYFVGWAVESRPFCTKYNYVVRGLLLLDGPSIHVCVLHHLHAHFVHSLLNLNHSINRAFDLNLLVDSGLTNVIQR